MLISKKTRGVTQLVEGKTEMSGRVAGSSPASPPNTEVVEIGMLLV